MRLRQTNASVPSGAIHSEISDRRHIRSRKDACRLRQDFPLWPIVENSGADFRRALQDHVPIRKTQNFGVSDNVVAVIANVIRDISSDARLGDGLIRLIARATQSHRCRDLQGCNHHQHGRLHLTPWVQRANAGKLMRNDYRNTSPS